MAIYHFSVKVLSRRHGQSAVAAGGYRHAMSVTNDLTGATKSYEGKKSELVHEAMLLPKDAPSWAIKRYGRSNIGKASEKLWNDIEKREETHNHRKVAQLAKSYTISLPKELSREQQVELIEAYTRSNLMQNGEIADIVIHDKRDGNPHAHIMTTLRGLEKNGFGKRIMNYTSSRMQLINDRVAWEAFANAALEKAGFEERIDHRSNLDRGLDLEPCSASPKIADKFEKSGGLYRGKVRAEAAKALNAKLLREDPEHILLVLGQEKALFSEEDIAYELRRKLPSTVLKSEIVHLVSQVISSTEIVDTGDRNYDDSPVYTTRAALEIARQLTRSTLQLRDKVLDLSDVGPDPELDPRLGADQRAAVEAMISGRGINIIEGYAGAGKTTAVIEASRVWAGRNWAVFGTAVSGKAVQELHRIHGATGTVAQIEAQWNAGALPPKGKFVVFMDEASMVGTAVWARFQSRVNAMGGKMVAIGDRAQHGPVNDTSALTHTASLVGVSQITNVRRQNNAQLERREDDRAAIVSISKGIAGIEPALRHFYSTGALPIAPSLEEARSLIIDNFFAGTTPELFNKPGHERLVVAHTNVEVNLLNEELQKRAIELGFASSEGGVEIKRSKNDPSPMVASKGTRIRFTEPFSEANVARNAIGTVLATTGTSLLVHVDKHGEPIMIDTKVFANFEYGNAVTVAKSQGMTVDGKVFGLITRMFDWHLLDVSLSRFVHENCMVVVADEFVDDPATKTDEAILRAVINKVSRSTIRLVKDANEPAVLRRAHQTLEEVLGTARKDRVVGVTSAEGGVPVEPVSLAGDVHIFQQVQQMVGLVRYEYTAGDPIFGGDQRGYGIDPLKVVDDLLAERGTLRVSDVTERLAQVVLEPETFVRLAYQAMAHPDLVVLSEDGLSGEGRIYSSVARVEQATALMDRAMRLAVQQTAFKANAPQIDGDDTKALLAQTIRDVAISSALTEAAQGALEAVLWPSRIAIIEEIGMGETAQIAAAAQHVIAEGRVLAVHPSRGVAERFGAQANIASTDLYRLGVDLEQGVATLGPQDVILVPAASALLPEQLEVLLSLTERHGNKIVLHSDPSVEVAGASLRHLSQRLPIQQVGQFNAIRVEHRGLLQGGADLSAAVAHLRNTDALLGARSEEAQIDAFIEAFLANPSAAKIGVAASSKLRAKLNVEIERTRRATMDVSDVTPMVVIDRGHFVAPLEVMPGAQIVVTRAIADHSLVAGEIGTVIGPGAAGGVQLKFGDRIVDLAAGKTSTSLELGYVLSPSMAQQLQPNLDHTYLFASRSLRRTDLTRVLQFENLTISVPADVNSVGTVEAYFEAISRRAPRGTILDYGFDPNKALAAAAPSCKVAQIEPRLVLDDRNQEVADLTKAAYRTNPEFIAADLVREEGRFGVSALANELRSYYSADDLGQAERVAKATDIIDKLVSDGVLVAAGLSDFDGAQRYTTRVQAELEAAALAKGRKLASKVLPDVSGPVDGTDHLRHVTSANRLSLVTAPADTAAQAAFYRDMGKVWRDRGYQIISVALMNTEATRCADLMGPDVKAASMVSLDAQWAMGKLPADGKFVVVLSQAEMIQSAQWARLQDRIDAMGGKLTAVAQPHDLPINTSISLYRALSRDVGAHAGTPQPSQKSEAERVASVLMAGTPEDSARAIEIHHELGNVYFAARTDGAIGAIGRNFWSGNQSSSRTQLAVAHSNKQVEALDAAIRKEGTRLGLLGETVTHGNWVANIGQKIYAQEAALPGVDDGQWVTLEASDSTGVQVRLADLSTVIHVPVGQTSFLNPSFARTIWSAGRVKADDVFGLASRGMDQALFRKIIGQHSDRLELHVPETDFKDIDAVKIAAGKCNDVEALKDAVTQSPLQELYVDGISNRRDRIAPLLKPRLFMNDAHLQSVAQRSASLLAIGYKPGEPVVGEDPHGYAGNPRKAVDDLITNTSVIRAEDVARKLSSMVRDPQTFVRLFAEAMAHPDLVVLSETGMRGEGRIYSTLAHIRRETDMNDRVMAMSMVPNGFVARPGSVAAATQTIHGPMSPDQERALHHATSGGRVTIVTGYAGSGKSSLLKGVREVYEAAGWDVVGTATSADVARNIGKVSGIRSRSLPSLLKAAEEDRLQLGPKSLMVVDSAELLDLEAYDSVVALAEKTGASLLLIGGDNQIQPRGPGAMFRSLTETIGASTLSNIQRQTKAADIEATVNLARGTATAGEAIRHYDRVGALIGTGAGDSKSDFLVAVARDYVADISADKVALAFTRSDVATLNELVRGAEKLRRDTSLTEMVVSNNKGEGLIIQAGDRVRLVEGAWSFGLVSGDKAVVADVNAVAKNYTLEVGRGDEKRFITMPVEGGPLLAYDYAQTIDSARAMSSQSVHVALTSNMAHDRTYQALTRHTDKLRIYTPTEQKDALEFATKVATRGAQKFTTLEREYGFDPHHAAEAAQVAKSKDLPVNSYLSTHGENAGAAPARLKLADFFKPDPSREALAPAAASRALSYVLEGRAILGEMAVDGVTQASVRRLLTDVSDPKAWAVLSSRLSRRELAQVDASARRWTGARDGEPLLAEARALARALAVVDRQGIPGGSLALKTGLELLADQVGVARETGTYDLMQKESLAPVTAYRDLVPAGEAIGQAKAYNGAGLRSPRRSFLGDIKHIYKTEFEQAKARAETRNQKAIIPMERSQKMSEDVVDALLSSITRFTPPSHEVHDLDAPRDQIRELYKAATLDPVPADKDEEIARIAQGIAHQRALNALRVQIALEIKPSAENYEWGECLARKTAPFFLFDPNSAQKFREVFAQRSEAIKGEAKPIDRVVARMSMLARERAGGVEPLAKALQVAAEYEEPTVESGKAALSARATVTTRIIEKDVWEPTGAEEQELLEDLYKGYTLTEITALAKPAQQMPVRSQPLSGDDRKKLSDRILSFANTPETRLAPRHSRQFANEIQNGARLGLQRTREQEKERSRSLDGPSWR